MEKAMTELAPGAGKSGQQVGQSYVAALETYLQALRAEGQGLPAKGGKVSTSAIALAAGVDRQSLYKNPTCRALLEAAAQEMGLAGIEAKNVAIAKDDGKDQRIQTLEARVAALTAEVHGLRRQLAQFGHIEAHLTATGRRVIP
jgi:AcrR family transcriptional regulator